jgi:hypothetical protein
MSAIQQAVYILIHAPSLHRTKIRDLNSEEKRAWTWYMRMVSLAVGPLLCELCASNPTKLELSPSPLSLFFLLFAEAEGAIRGD